MEGPQLVPGAPVQPRRQGGAPVRLLAILLGLNLAMFAASYAWFTRISPTGVDLVVAERPVEVVLPGSPKPRRLPQATDLPPGAVVQTRQTSRTVLNFGGATIRLARNTKVRVLQAGPLPSTGADLQLEAGRVWIQRGSSWVPVRLHVDRYRLESEVGHFEVSRKPLAVRAWTTPVQVEDLRGGKTFQVERGVAAALDPGAGNWRRRPLPGRVDRWAVWNMQSPSRDLLTGAVLDLETAWLMDRPEEFGFPPSPPRTPRARWGVEPDPSPSAPRVGRDKAPPGRLVLPGLPTPDYPVRKPGSLQRAGERPLPPEFDPDEAWEEAPPEPGGTAPAVPPDDGPGASEPSEGPILPTRPRRDAAPSDTVGG